LDPFEDNALMLQVKSGKVDKLGLLYERYSRRLFGFFYHQNGNASISEDLVQNVFMRILKYKHTFSDDGQFITWLFHLARNVNKDHFRKNKRYHFQDSMNDWNEKMADKENVEMATTKQEEGQLLRIAMNRLDPEKKEILYLAKFQKLKYQEIASLLDCTEGAVKVKVHRALKDLKMIYLKLENVY